MNEAINALKEEIEYREKNKASVEKDSERLIAMLEKNKASIDSHEHTIRSLKYAIEVLEGIS